MYRITLHQDIQAEDITLLPEELREDFIQYQRVLKLDPYQTRGVPSHDLRGDLKSFAEHDLAYERAKERK